MLSGTLTLINFFTKYGATIISVAATLATYTLAVKVQAYWDNIHYGFLVAKTAITKAYRFTVDVLTGRIALATVAQHAWNLAQKMNPIGLIIGLLVAAGAALFLYTRKLTDAEIAQKALNDLKSEAQQSIIDEKVKMEQLLRVAQNETLSKAARLEAIKKLNALSPDYLGGLTLETINTQAATVATDKYIASLIRKAELELANDKLKASAKKIAELKDGKGEEAGFFQTFSRTHTSKTAKGWTAVRKEATLENQKAAIAAEEINMKVYQDKIDSLVKSSPSANTSTTVTPTTLTTPNAPTTPGSPIGIEDKNKAAMAELKAAFEERLLIIKQAYLNEEITKKEYEAKMEVAALAHLEVQRQLLINEKQDTANLDLQIVDARIKIHEEAQKTIEGFAIEQEENLSGSIDAMIKLGDDLINEYNRIEKETDDTNQKKAQSFLDLASSVGDSFADTLMSQEKDFGQFLKNTLVMALDALEKVLLMSMAEAAIKDIATKGFIGIATAAAKIVLMKAAFGAAKALILSSGKGKAEGGYTEPGGKYEPAGIVHKGEYVIPQEGVNNPILRPFINVFEMARRNNSLARLDLRPMVQMAGQPSGYASGGFTGSPSAGSGSSSPIVLADPEQAAAFREMAAEFRLLRTKGIRANINKYGTNGLMEAYDDITSLKSKVNKQ